MTRTLPRAFMLLAFLVGTQSIQGGDLADLDLNVRHSDIAPAVTLREHENRLVEEFRVNNNLYMIKITPSVGAPYFLVDEDGSGDMAWHRGASQFQENIPQWALFSW
jgi:hypothetical protein